MLHVTISRSHVLGWTILTTQNVHQLAIFTVHNQPPPLTGCIIHNRHH